MWISIILRGCGFVVHQLPLALWPWLASICHCPYGTSLRTFIWQASFLGHGNLILQVSTTTSSLSLLTWRPPGSRAHTSQEQRLLCMVALLDQQLSLLSVIFRLPAKLPKCLLQKVTSTAQDVNVTI